MLNGDRNQIVPAGRAILEARFLEMMALLLLALFALPAFGAGDLKVYSEFRRIGLDGQVIAADRGGTPREILSPRVARGAWASFQLVVEAPAETEFWLYVGQNPDNAARVKLYRVLFRQGQPDQLQPVEEPAHASVLGGHQAAVYWLDVLYPNEGPAGRVKLEPQLFVPADKHWVVYPMEMNVMPAPRVRTVIEKVSGQPGEGRADDIAARVIRSFWCPGAKAGAAAEVVPRTVADMIERNARQDVVTLRRLSPAALASVLPPQGEFCAGRIGLGEEQMVTVRGRMYKMLEDSSKLKETDP